MECMVKFVKPMYAIKCIVGWLAGIYSWECVLSVKMCWIHVKMGPLVRYHEMGLRSPHSCYNRAHPSI